MDVTFVVVSYNQENTVLHTLESIRYQVERYGKNKKVQLIIADDASEDSTYFLEQKWIDLYKDYFSQIDILPSNQHRGINHNFLRAIDYIKGNFFKGIAGDDLLANANLFKILENDGTDLHIASYFCFNGSSKLSVDCAHYIYWETELDGLRSCSKYVTVPITALSLIYSKQLMDEGYRMALSRYTYIDDVPIWDYMMQKNRLRIKYTNIPVILYRLSGQNVSKGGTSNPHHINFLNDKLKLYSDRIEHNNDILGKYISLMNMKREVEGNIIYSIINPYRYYHKFNMLIHKKKIYNLTCELEKKYKENNVAFLHEIKKRAKDLLHAL